MCSWLDGSIDHLGNLVVAARHVIRSRGKHDFLISPTEPPLDLAIVVLSQEHIHKVVEKEKIENAYLVRKILQRGKYFSLRAQKL